MTTTINTRIEPFEEKDDEGFSRDCNNITAEIVVDGKVVWTKTVPTDDAVESVFDTRDFLRLDAFQIAVKEHGYSITDEEVESLGLVAVTA